MEVTTDKVDAEIPSPAAGVVEKILVREGDTLAVGDALVMLAPDAETTHTLAEIAVALAGFSGIVAVLRRGGVSDWTAVERAHLFALLYPAFGVVFFAFVPPLAASILSPAAALRVSHGLLLVFMLAGLAVYLRTAPLQQGPHSLTTNTLQMRL